jgi:hypothetical protein
LWRWGWGGRWSCSSSPVASVRGGCADRRGQTYGTGSEEVVDAGEDVGGVVLGAVVAVGAAMCRGEGCCKGGNEDCSSSHCVQCFSDFKV